MNGMPSRSNKPSHAVIRLPASVAGCGCDALGGGGGGFGLGGGVSCVGRFGGRVGGAGREDEPAVSSLSYSALLAGSLRISHASFSRLVVASAVGLGFRSG